MIKIIQVQLHCSAGSTIGFYSGGSTSSLTSRLGLPSETGAFSAMLPLCSSSRRICTPSPCRSVDLFASSPFSIEALRRSDQFFIHDVTQLFLRRTNFLPFSRTQFILTDYIAAFRQDSLKKDLHRLPSHLQTRGVNVTQCNEHIYSFFVQRLIFTVWCDVGGVVPHTLHHGFVHVSIEPRPARVGSSFISRPALSIDR